MRPGHQQRAVTQGLDFEAPALGLGQKRGENVEEAQGNSGLLANAGNVGGGVRDRAEGMVTMNLTLAPPNVLSGADLLNFPGRKEHLPPPPNVSGRKEQDLFCQCRLQ